MNINIVNSEKNILEIKKIGRYVLEVSSFSTLDDFGTISTRKNPKKNNQSYSSYKRISISLLDVDKNIYVFSGEKYFITDAIKICDSVWESKSFYFTSVSFVDDEIIKVDVIKYDTEILSEKVIYSFAESKKILEGAIRLSIFILSEIFVFIQKESLDETKDEHKLSRISFSQQLINLETNETNDIYDENLINNGLFLMIPISPILVLIKTGSSFIEDDMLKTNPANELLIESVFINTVNKFIADLSLNKKNIDMELVYSSYSDKYIVKLCTAGEFIFFNIINGNDGSSEAFFYNFVNQDKYLCKNENIDITDFNTSYIINGTPYIRNGSGKKTIFINLKTMKSDISSLKYDFADIVGNIILLKKIKHNRSYICAYNYPNLDMLFEERADFVKGCFLNDEYCFYIRK